METRMGMVFTEGVTFGFERRVAEINENAA
jgi:hypothetical protein